MPTPPRRIAVLVGVNDYVEGSFVNLKFAERDVTELKTELEAAGDEVVMLLGSARGEAEATRENIAAVLLDRNGKRFALRALTAADTVVVALSGQGQQVRGKEGDKEVEAPFFCPKDAKAGDPPTLVSVNAVLDALDQSKATALVLVDAGRGFAKDGDGLKLAHQGRGAAIDRGKVSSLRPGLGVMFACSDRQEAMEFKEAGGGHGLFFCAVLEALRDGPRNKRGELTWSRLVAEVHDRGAALSERLDKRPKEERARPQSVGNFSGDPVVLPTP